MFSDKYKEETEQLTLDDEFLTKLKQNMRDEQERLQQINGNDETTATKEQEPTRSSEKSYHWKHTLPVALTACAAIALIALFPNIVSNFASKKENAIAYDTAASESMNSGSIESFQKGDSKDVDSDTSSTMDSAESSVEFKEEAEADSEEISSEDSVVESDSLEKGENTLESAATEEMEQPGFSRNVLYEDGTWSYTNTQEFIPTSPEILESLQQRFMDSNRMDLAPTIDYVGNGIIVFHDYYGLVIYDYDTESIKRLVDLPSRIGDFVTTGEGALEVQFYNNGDYIFLDPHQTDTVGTPICFLYEVATDIMIQMTKDTLATLNLVAVDRSNFTGTDSFASYLDLKNASSQAIQSEDCREYILYYASDEDLLVSSLNIYEIRKDSDGNIVNTREMPVYILQ